MLPYHVWYRWKTIEQVNTITNKLFLLLLDRIINGTKTSKILVNVLIKVKVFARMIISCTVVKKQLTTELSPSNLFVCTVHCTLYNLTGSIQCIIKFGLNKVCAQVSTKNRKNPKILSKFQSMISPDSWGYRLPCQILLRCYLLEGQS